MQNLNALLAAWRSNVEASGELTPSQIAELEAHLLDAVDHLKAAGLAPDEAFLIAVRRLGETDVLSAEFAKAHPHQRARRTMLWMLTGAFAYFLLTIVLNAVSAFATWALVPHVGILGGTLAGQGMRFGVIALLLVLVWRGSTWRRAGVLATVSRIKRLKPIHVIGFAIGAFLTAGLAKLLMTQAMHQHVAAEGVAVSYTLSIGMNTLATLALLVVVPLMIHRFRGRAEAV